MWVVKGIIKLAGEEWHQEMRVTRWVAMSLCSVEPLPGQSSCLVESCFRLFVYHVFACKIGLATNQSSYCKDQLRNN